MAAPEVTARRGRAPALLNRRAHDAVRRRLAMHRRSKALPVELAGKQRARLQLYILLVACDCLAVAAGFGIGNLLRFGDLLAPGGINLLLVLLPVFLVFALRNEAYAIDVLVRPLMGCRRAVMSLAAAAIMVIFVIFFMKTSSAFSRLALALGAAAAALLISLLRFGAAAIGRRLLGGSPLREVIIRDGGSCARPEGWTDLDAAQLGLTPDISDPLMLDRIGRLLRQVDRVVIACRPESRRAWAVALKGVGLRGEIVEPAAGDLGVLGIGHHADQSTLVVSSGSLGFRDRAAKRLLDLGLATATLVFLAPVMLAIALAIRLEDGGPVFFRQQRLGHGNRLFDVFKFRSMRAAAGDAAGQVSTARDDDRVTRIGRLIRAASLDELPQLLNILAGDMSFVGPRPHALGSLAGDKLFWEVDQRYWHRHAAKPGLTGLAQIRGFRGATAFQSDLIDRLQADLEYLKDWSIWRDLRIIVMTLRVVVHRNAF